MSLMVDGIRSSQAWQPVERLTESKQTARPVQAPLRPTTRRRHVGALDGIRPHRATPLEVLRNNNLPPTEPAPAPIPALIPNLGSAAVALPNAVTAASGLRKYQWLAVPMLAVLTLPIAARVHTQTTAHQHTQSAKIATASAAVATTPKIDPNAAAIAAAAAVTSQSNQLQGVLDGFVAAQGSKTSSIIVKDLKTGAIASHNPDQVLTSASLYKLFVALAVYRQIDQGKLNYTTPAGSGTGRNVADCLRVMINVSDNACGNALGTLIGWNGTTNLAKSEGFSNTNLVAFPMHTSATDVTKLFERLYNGTLLSPDSTKQFLALLQDQRVNNRLPVGLPAGTTIAHKTGDLFGFVHDAGIVYGPKSTYLITVMMGPGSSYTPFASISQQVYQTLNQ